jgi:hypothetical protein
MITIKLTPEQATELVKVFPDQPESTTKRLVDVIKRCSLSTFDLKIRGRRTSAMKGAYPYGFDGATAGYLRRNEVYQLYRWLLIAHRLSSGSLKGKLKRTLNKVCSLLNIDAVTRLGDVARVEELIKAKKARGKKRPVRRSCSPHCLPALGAHSASCRVEQAPASDA